MSHHIYTTPGFVIDSRPHREAGKLLFIFTRELGLVIASAQGVRLDGSKLRYHTQDFSYAHFSLVRGKEMWRLVGAVDSTMFTQVSEAHANVLYVRVLALLRRLLHGEEAHPELFDMIEAAARFFDSKEFLAIAIPEEERLVLAECVIVLRILHMLGYIGNVSELNSIISTTVWDEKNLIGMREVKSLAVKHINAGLKASQL